MLYKATSNNNRTKSSKINNNNNICKNSGGAHCRNNQMVNFDGVAGGGGPLNQLPLATNRIVEMRTCLRTPTIQVSSPLVLQGGKLDNCYSSETSKRPSCQSTKNKNLQKSNPYGALKSTQIMRKNICSLNSAFREISVDNNRIGENIIKLRQ